MADKSKATADQGVFTALYDRLKVQQDQIDDCRVMMERMASASAMESIAQHGWGQMYAMLEPLRQIVPQRTALAEEDARALIAIREALKRPEYSRFGELPISAFDQGYRADARLPRSTAS